MTDIGVPLVFFALVIASICTLRYALMYWLDADYAFECFQQQNLEEKFSSEFFSKWRKIKCAKCIAAFIVLFASALTVSYLLFF